MVVNTVRDLQPLDDNDARLARPCPLLDPVDVPLARINQHSGPRFLRWALALVLKRALAPQSKKASLSIFNLRSRLLPRLWVLLNTIKFGLLVMNELLGLCQSQFRRWLQGHAHWFCMRTNYQNVGELLPRCTAC